MMTTADILVPTTCGKPSSRCCPPHHPATAVVRAGVPWRLLPTREFGCGSPVVTCWRRLCDWQRPGVWQHLHHRLLDELGRQGQLDWSRASVKAERPMDASAGLARVATA
jgi:transposase